MSTTSPHGTAKIYAFPAGGRSRGGRNDWSAPSPAARERTPDIMPASGGYHDAAIREERARKP
ncbi:MULTISPECIES: DUF2735 domain-containing protein [Methylobacterium]|jgi:hypothetical protein|uniref:DUF2735 domain-containing protein n=1 Tax=Methylobacterium TaxID=407 RepID=UPI0008E7DEAA|nr:MULTISPECIES: DUF2735 domain-containing protein [Methylobacterium]MBK3396654.1 DUF2735 domain-containing protein [Methylobacterium ajmalii]MBK3409999.1 DUF2735 domain-containing protein [Methylobacterium ajmalii]MBK3426271.1 DUF2735 domain-containing protein [Methylobacterium ajmalii]MBZ6411138.1 DUF2735 domain-containing protein [Methylobacterium sp.]SFE19226.1 Protein of unknown function [Methylobacterium sp. yr596]